MRRLLFILPLLLAGLASAPAQNRPLDTTPAISLAFPFMEESNLGVLNKYPVLINDTTILPAKSVLRVIYTPPRIEDDRLRAIRSSNNSDASWTRDNRLRDVDKLSPSEQARQKIARETVWPSITNFQLALANTGADDLRLVYLVTSGDKPEDFKFYEQRLVLPEGLLLAEINGAVTILAVEKDKPGDRAGLKAGDIVLKAGERSTNGSLATYLESYHAVRKDALVGMKTSFAFTVKSADGAERVASIKLPPSINSGFLDTPIDTTPASRKDSSTSTNTAPALVPEVWEKKKPTAPPAPNP